MNLSLRYGLDTRDVRLPVDTVTETVEPSVRPPLDDVDDALARAVGTPVGGTPLGERIDARTQVLVIVSDPTRGGTAQMLPSVVRALRTMGVDAARIRVLVARGTHRSLTTDEKELLRSRDLKGIDVKEHDCDDTAHLSALVMTPSGTRVRVNRVVRDADLILLVSGVSFHYFAGFGGGRKLILPGCADRSAILANHRLALDPGPPVALHTGCRPGNLVGNPVHDDMIAALSAVSETFAINYFCGPNGRPTFVNAGDAVVSHAEACDEYAIEHRVSVSPCEVVIASCGGHPYDVNLLQAHKAILHAARAARPGATLLVFACCPEGVGSASLTRAMEMPRKKFLASAHKEYDLNNQTGISLLGLTAKFRIGMVSGLDGALLDHAGIIPVENVEAFIASALDGAGSRRVVVVPYGARTLPVDPENPDS